MTQSMPLFIFLVIYTRIFLNLNNSKMNGSLLCFFSITIRRVRPDEIFVPESFPPTCHSRLSIFATSLNSHCFLPVADFPLLVEILRTCYAGVQNAADYEILDGRFRVKHTAEFYYALFLIPSIKRGTHI